MDLVVPHRETPKPDIQDNRGLDVHVQGEWCIVEVSVQREG